MGTVSRTGEQEGVREDEVCVGGVGFEFCDAMCKRGMGDVVDDAV